MAEIARKEGFPAVTTIWEWAKDDPELSESIARARAMGFDAIANRARATARGLTEAEGGESSGDTQRDKLIIDTDLKLLAKWDPKRYGDRVTTELTGANGGPVAVIQATIDATQAAEEYRKLMQGGD